MDPGAGEPSASGDVGNSNLSWTSSFSSSSSSSSSSAPDTPNPSFPFELLLPELKCYFFEVAPLTVSVLLGWTCRALHQHPNRPTVSLWTFARAICEEGLAELLPFIFSINTGKKFIVFSEEDMALAAERGHVELILGVLRWQHAKPDKEKFEGDLRFCPLNFGPAVRAAAKHQRYDVLHVLYQHVRDDVFRPMHLAGAMQSGNVDSIDDLPDGTPYDDFYREAFRSAPLPVLKQLFQPEQLRSDVFCFPAVENPDPLVLPWCIELGMTLPPPDLLLRICVDDDCLASFVFLVNHFNVQREQLSEFVSLAFLFGAWRILNHCLEVMKFPFTSLVPNRIKPKWSSSTDFFRKAPSYSRALDFLERAGLAQLMDLSEVELCPDLDFLKGMIRLGMPLDRLALERLVVWATVRIEWRPRFETALFWLIDQGAPMSEELFAKIVNPVFRPAVFQRLLERGCPSSALAYEELVSTMYEDDTLIPQRYFLLRASNVPVPLWKSEKDRPPNQLFISAVLQQPLDVLADILEANGFKSIPPHWFNLVFYKNRDDLAPRLRAIAPLCEGRLLSTLYARVTAEQWLSLSFGLDEDWQPFLQLAIDFFTSVLPDLPLPTWPEFIRVYLSTCSQWDQVPKGRDLGWVPRLLDWFACSGRMGPVINPRDVFEDVVLLSLRPSQTRPRAYEAKVRAVCEFLRARGATIEEEEIANYLEQQQPRARTHK